VSLYAEPPGVTMNEAAPQAAGTGADEDQQLAALRFNWGEAYRIGWDPVREWWAHRTPAISLPA
jgi:hypothetical protein